MLGKSTSPLGKTVLILIFVYDQGVMCLFFALTPL
jgi:hypothetical protein